jgi:hypothetical protein
MPAGWLLLGAGAVASLIVRFWRSRGEERQQLEWFVYAVVLLLLVKTVGQLFSTALLPSALREFLFVFTLEGLWIALGIAILRYSLYDIELLINRTLVYGSLTVTLALVYFAGVTVTQAMLRTLSGQGSTLAVVASTLVIAALFSPLRRQMQSFIDGRFYRQKYDVRQTLETFCARLRDETDLGTLNYELVEAVQETLQPAHVSLWLRESEWGPDTRR